MVLYGYYTDMKLDVKEIFRRVNILLKKWQHLEIIALKAEHTVLISADVEGPTINGKRCCRVR